MSGDTIPPGSKGTLKQEYGYRPLVESPPFYPILQGAPGVTYETFGFDVGAFCASSSLVFLADHITVACESRPE